MASAEFSEGDEEKRPTVQVGDPFTEKLLIEACLELMATDWIQSIQDMGAAGLTSSSVEIADKGGVGVEMDMDKVPQRETGMTAYEIMLSESQERMLMVLKPGQRSRRQEDLRQVGPRRRSHRLHHRHRPAGAEAAGPGRVRYSCPAARRRMRRTMTGRGTPPKPAPALDISKYPEPADYGEVLLKLMSSPDMASKRWIWEQYDRHVMGDTIDSSQSGGDAAIVRIHGTNKALAICSDCNPHYVAADPYEGGKQAVAEAYRNLSAVGATPIAITDNLNFGNPEKPDTMGVIVKAIEGMAEACRVLDFPVVSGNVSLYNETDGVGIPPTPVVGGIGLIENLDHIATLKGAQAGDELARLSARRRDTSARRLCARDPRPRRPGSWLAAAGRSRAREKRNAAFVRKLIHDGLVNAVHDVSEGGIACAAAEMALAAGVGVSLVLDRELRRRTRRHGLFGEDQARYLSRSPSADRLSNRSAGGVTACECASASSRTSSSGDAVVHADRLSDTRSTEHDPSPSSTLRAAHEGWLPDYMNAGSAA